ncbi:3-phosphoshikimate 1-carboxyvinyltransferase [Bacillus sp. CGMCC 1.16607]|uniref:3-phosphoshikimate 1-carboxyvinyltransferase n=1 Tax=Bacillus sp. CGMCC 1.16607 TaxID=3351842 RepID=UPI0036312BD9
MGTQKLIHNIHKLEGHLNIPGDKSISHRSIMFGAIANGKTTVTNFLKGEDCLSTIACFKELGIDIEVNDDLITIEGKGWEHLKEPVHVLNVGNSGTTIRLMLGLLSGRPFHAAIVGDESIGKRPMKRVINPLREMGAKINGRNNGEFIPISVVGGDLKPISYNLPVASAQVKSALLLAGLQADGITQIIEPTKTRDHTERMIRQFGGEIKTDGLSIVLKGPQTLTGTKINVPGDISSAAFFLVAGAIVPDSKIHLKNVGLNPTRTGIVDVLNNMGANISIVSKNEESYEPVGELIIQTSELVGSIIEGELIPRLIDEIPIIALLATQANGTTVIKDAEELKVKETNRIDTVVNELNKLGADIVATEDGMVINGPTRLHGGKVSTHGDHRIGMMLAIAALICKEEVYLEDSEAVAVSYPNFFNDLSGLIK